MRISLQLSTCILILWLIDCLSMHLVQTSQFSPQMWHDKLYAYPNPLKLLMALSIPLPLQLCIWIDVSVMHNLDVGSYFWRSFTQPWHWYFPIHDLMHNLPKDHLPMMKGTSKSNFRSTMVKYIPNDKFYMHLTYLVAHTKNLFCAALWIVLSKSNFISAMVNYVSNEIFYTHLSYLVAQTKNLFCAALWIVFDPQRWHMVKW